MPETWCSLATQILLNVVLIITRGRDSWSCCLPSAVRPSVGALIITRRRDSWSCVRDVVTVGSGYSDTALLFVCTGSRRSQRLGRDGLSRDRCRYDGFLGCDGLSRDTALRFVCTDGWFVTVLRYSFRVARLHSSLRRSQRRYGCATVGS